MCKTLYGLMQAARAWNLRLHQAMLDIRYTCVSADHCIYVCGTSSGSSIVAVHVNDMCAAASDMAEMAKLKWELGKVFNLVDLGELTWLLGITVTQDRHAHTISLCQTAYIEGITKCLHLEDAHPVAMPLDSNVMLSKALGPMSNEDKIRMSKIPYLTAVRCVMYAA